MTHQNGLLPTEYETLNCKGELGMQAHGSLVDIGLYSSTKLSSLKCLYEISLNSAAFAAYSFSRTKCVLHGCLCSFVSQRIYPGPGCKPLFCSKHSSGVLIPFEKPHVKLDLDTPFSLLFSRGLMVLGCSLVSTCFLRGLSVSRCFPHLWTELRF